MGKKLKGETAETFKKNILPEIDHHLTGLLKDTLEEPPAHIIIFFENNETSRTHYRHSADALYIPQVVETLRALADDLEAEWKKKFPNQN